MASFETLRYAVVLSLSNRLRATRAPTDRTETILDTPNGVAEARLSPEPHLFVLYQGSSGGGAGSRHSLRGLEEVRIGRGSAHRFTRSHDGTTAVGSLELACTALSSVHLSIRREAGGWVARDLGSKNGTIVQGERIERRELHDGDVIEAGRVVLRFRSALPTPATASADATGDDAARRPEGLRTLLPALDASFAGLLRVARAPVSVLLLGPTGAGKELAARAIHEASGRAGPFVPLNCGAIPATLVEATLFGHVRGAFSGATRDELGTLRSAHGGTLLLDEVGDLPASTQVAFLRALQEGEVTPVGASRPAFVDVRVVAATHRPLGELVASGAFREDLYARLSGFVCELPPLRDRVEDFGLILPALLARLGQAHGRSITLERGVVRAMVAYSWPRNVRELAQHLSGAAALADAGPIAQNHLPPEVRDAVEPARASAEADPRGVPTNFPAVPYEDDTALRALLHALLGEHAGNIAAVSRAIGRKPAQVHRWMKRVGLTPSAYRAP